MDIGAVSTSVSQASVSQQTGIAVAKKVMDSFEQSSQQLIRMMELSVNPGLGSNFDVSV